MFIDVLNHPDFGKYDVSSLKTGIMAGAPCPVVLCERLIAEMGMSEFAVHEIEVKTS